MIECTGLSCTAGGRTILEGIDLQVRKGEIFTLIGPSGSGKTTLLRLIDLLDRPSGGRLAIDGTDTNAAEPVRLMLRRRMGMVFQKPVVLNTTVRENVAFGLKFRGQYSRDSAAAIDEKLALVGLPDFAGRKAVTLSGGEMQRVALARAMITDPEILILDEPTANLDPVSSEAIENLIVRINKEMHTTILLSTHDMVQGQRLADRIGVILGGRIAQTGTIAEIFYQPKTRSLARFVGADTIIRGVVRSNDQGLARIDVSGIPFEALTPAIPGKNVLLIIRPEEVSLTLPDGQTAPSSVRNRIGGTIAKIVPFGPFVRVHITDPVPVTALVTRRSCMEMGFAPGTPVVVGIKATAIHVVPVTDENP